MGGRLEHAVSQRAEAHGNEQLDKDEEEEDLGPCSFDVGIVVEVDPQEDRALDQDRKQHEKAHVAGEDTFARVARWPPHDVAVGRRKSEGQRRQSVGGQVDVENCGGQQRQQLRPRDDDDTAQHYHFRDVGAQQIGQVLLDVVVDPAAALDCLHDRREIIIAEHHVSGFLRDIGSADSHGDPDVRMFQRGRVVHAISRHRDDFAAVLPCAHDLQLVHG